MTPPRNAGWLSSSRTCKRVKSLTHGASLFLRNDCWGRWGTGEETAQVYKEPGTGDLFCNKLGTPAGCRPVGPSHPAKGLLCSSAASLRGSQHQQMLIIQLQKKSIKTISIDPSLSGRLGWHLSPHLQAGVVQMSTLPASSASAQVVHDTRYVRHVPPVPCHFLFTCLFR